MPIPDTSPSPAPAARRSPLPAPGESFDAAGVPAPGSVLALRPNKPFLVCHHRDNWSLETEGLEGPMWLPDLQFPQVVPGVGGARTVGRGEDSSKGYDLMARNLERQGMVVLYDTVQVRGFGGGYLKGLPCKDPKNNRVGTFWVLRWESPAYRRAGAKQRFTLDRAEFNRWRLALVEQGLIAPPHQSVVDYRKQRAAYALDRRQKQTGLEPAHKDELLAEARERLEAMDQATVPAAGDSDVARALRALTVPVLREIAGPLGRGKRKEDLVELLAHAGLTAEEVKTMTADKGGDA